MLATVYDLNVQNIENVNLGNLANVPLLEIFITLFLNNVKKLCVRGLKADYQDVEENEPFLRGRLLIKENIRFNMFNHARFYCNYQVFSENRSENRLLLSALLKVSALTTITANNQLAIEMLPYFSQISESDNFHLDAQQWRTGPEMEDYRQLHSWCQLLLNCHPMLSSGEISAESIMFPMERLFEAYVQAMFKQQFRVPNHYCVNNTGLAGKAFYLASWQHDDADVLSHKDIFLLKPDIVVFNDEQPVLILDAKWKLLDDDKNQKSIKEADVYQMLAYAHALRPSSGNLCLIFPKFEGFKQPVIFKFRHQEGEQGYQVLVIPFDISNDEFIGVDNWQRLISVN